MRIDIKTKTPVRDRDVRALYLINKALEISTPRMRETNLRFFLRDQDWRDWPRPTHLRR